MRCLHMCALGEISICIRDLCLEICLFREILSKNITLRGIFILMSIKSVYVHTDNHLLYVCKLIYM